MVYPWLQRRAHEEPDTKVAPFAQAASRAPFWGVDRPVTAQLRGTHAIEPVVVVPVLQEGWVKEMVYPLLHIKLHEEPDGNVSVAAPERTHELLETRLESTATVQLLATQVIDPEVKVPSKHVG